jgi:hypothetical protein
MINALHESLASRDVGYAPWLNQKSDDLRNLLSQNRPPSSNIGRQELEDHSDGRYSLAFIYTMVFFLVAVVRLNPDNVLATSSETRQTLDQVRESTHPQID